MATVANGLVIFAHGLSLVSGKYRTILANIISNDLLI